VRLKIDIQQGVSFKTKTAFQGKSNSRCELAFQLETALGRDRLPIHYSYRIPSSKPNGESVFASRHPICFVLVISNVNEFVSHRKFPCYTSTRPFTVVGGHSTVTGGGFKGDGKSPPLSFSPSFDVLFDSPLGLRRIPRYSRRGDEVAYGGWQHIDIIQPSLLLSIQIVRSVNNYTLFQLLQQLRFRR
jgi:hypothetical protein